MKDELLQCVKAFKLFFESLRDASDKLADDLGLVEYDLEQKER